MTGRSIATSFLLGRNLTLIGQEQPSARQTILAMELKTHVACALADHTVRLAPPLARCAALALSPSPAVTVSTVMLGSMLELGREAAMNAISVTPRMRDLQNARTACRENSRRRRRTDASHARLRRFLRAGRASARLAATALTRTSLNRQFAFTANREKSRIPTRPTAIYAAPATIAASVTKRALNAKQAFTLLRAQALVITAPQASTPLFAHRQFALPAWRGPSLPLESRNASLASRENTQTLTRNL